MHAKQSQPPSGARTPTDQPPDLHNDPANLVRLSRVLSGEAEEDARLEELRERVVGGAYEVPAGDLSARLVKSLLGGKPPTDAEASPG